MTESARDAPVLMVVHAHPDDESSSTGGTLAYYADRGCQTILVTCTDGRLGDVEGGAKPGQAGHDPRRVARRRSEELDAAATALRITRLVELGYPDSGIDDECADEAFSRRPIAPLVQEMVRLMRMHRPDVVITYPPNGLSGHPDHIRTHDVVAAHRDLVAGGGAPKLFYVALSKSRVRVMQENAAAAFGGDSWAPPDDMSVDDEMITTVIDVEPYWPAKLAGLAAHSSQADAAMLLRMFSAGTESGARGGHVEEYTRVYPPVTRVYPDVESDLFAAESG